MPTISRRATRKIAALKGELTECKVYTLENYFFGKPTDPERAWEALDRYPSAKLRDRGDGTYHIDVHSNCWYELSKPEA